LLDAFIQNGLLFNFVEQVGKTLIQIFF